MVSKIRRYRFNIAHSRLFHFSHQQTYRFVMQKQLQTTFIAGTFPLTVITSLTVHVKTKSDISVMVAKCTEVLL